MVFGEAGFQERVDRGHCSSGCARCAFRRMLKSPRSTAGLMVGEKLRPPHVSRRRPRLREFADTAQEVGPVHGRMRTKSFESEPRAKLCELKGAIERMGDLVRRYCGRRDAQGNPHTLLRTTFA